MGFAGGERTTRRTVAAVKQSFQAGRRRVFRPWIPEPGLWMQFDWGEGPRIGGRRTSLWCAWLAWSRFRVVIPFFDKTLPTIVACLDATLRRLGGVPAYVLTDNEKTITVEYVADVAVRNPEIVQVARHYGMARQRLSRAAVAQGRRAAGGRVVRGGRVLRNGVRRKPIGGLPLVLPGLRPPGCSDLGRLRAPDDVSIGWSGGDGAWPPKAEGLAELVA